MSVSIRRLTAGFAGEVTGVDTTRPLPQGMAEELDAGMAEHGVLVFPGQALTDEQQAAFSQNFGRLEMPSAVSNITKEHERRLGPAMADVSNLTKEQRPFDREDRRRMFNLGNRLWHSDSSFRAVPAKYSLLS
ncbi:MAG: TauD/TfdA family dioxygenase, partial [Alphaproteobacteria bacterium]|nr:TauD/TfdA family dioxygenase [Alphaproteobacteria bacterium]